VGLPWEACGIEERMRATGGGEEDWLGGTLQDPKERRGCRMGAHLGTMCSDDLSGVCEGQHHGLLHLGLATALHLSLEVG
jgi:hypothetical protein